MTAILFNSLFPIAWIIPIAILSLAALSWLEIRRNQRLLPARLFALLAAILSIGCLILNPSISTRKSSNIIVLTQRFNKDTLDSLLNASPESQLYKLKDVAANNDVEEIKNYRQFSELKGNLMILGEGVPQYTLEYVDTSSLQFFPVRIPEGITGIDQKQIYSANQPAKLSGILKSTKARTVKLAGPGMAEDSIRVNADSLKAFSLIFTPKAPGLFLYDLTVSDSSGKILNSEQVPVQVKAQKSLSILILGNYPTAEIRFLKNFLEDQNHKIALRYKISKDKFRTEFVNTPQKTLGSLNEKLLQNFDLVITDASSLASLSANEIREMKEAMKLGLGVITLIDTSTPIVQTKDFLNFKLSKIKSDSATVRINNQKFKIPATAVAVSSERRLVTLQHEISGRILSGYHPIGLGKSGFQLLTNTFSLSLAGEKEVYAAIWSSLLQTVARNEIKKYDFRFITPFPYYQDEPIEFKIIATSEKPTVKMDSSEIQLLEDPLIKNVWYGKTWTGNIGWNSLQIVQDSSEYNFFVSQPDVWNSLQLFNQHRSLQKLTSEKEDTVQRIVIQPISRTIFLILFLLAAGFLWLAPKL